VIARQDGERLLIDDLLATRPFSLRDALPHVCRHPVRTIEFGFHPEAWWQDAESLSFDDDGAPLAGTGESGGRGGRPLGGILRWGKEVSCGGFTRPPVK
jgi:hypothetical protein